MKILHVLAALDHGGTEVSCRDIARVFGTSYGVENAIVAVRRGTGSIESELSAAASCGVSIAPHSRFRRGTLLLWFYRKCRAARPDGVLFHFFGIDQVIMATAARLAGVRRISAKAGNPAPNYQQLPGLARKWATIMVFCRILRVKIVAASSAIFESLSELATLPDGSVVIHNGCFCQEIFSRARASTSRRGAAKPFVIGTVARIDPIKDHETLLKAFHLLHIKSPGQWQLRIIGDGVLRARQERLCVSLGISECVEFMGNRTDIPEQLGQLDLFVLSTTRDEGFGIVLVEALASGVAVIASDVPACREVLQGGKLGVLVTPADPKALAAEIWKLAHRTQDTNGRVLREDVLAAYDISRAARRHLMLFRPALSR